MSTNTNGGVGFGGLIDAAAALLAIGAGVYLLQYNAVSSSLDGTTGTSWFQIIGHGMGIYFIGKGLFMGRSAYLAGRTADNLKYMAEWVRYDHQDEILKVERAASEVVPVD